MTRLFNKLRLWLLPPIGKRIGKRKAAQIARQALIPCVEQFKVLSEKPEGINVYGLPSEPIWYIFAPWGDGMDGVMLRSSRLLIISKKTGQVLYNGSANNEG